MGKIKGCILDSVFHLKSDLYLLKCIKFTVDMGNEMMLLKITRVRMHLLR